MGCKLLKLIKKEAKKTNNQIPMVDTNPHVSEALTPGSTVL